MAYVAPRSSISDPTRLVMVGTVCGDVSSLGGSPENTVLGFLGKAHANRPGRGREESLILRGVWVLRTALLGHVPLPPGDSVSWAVKWQH